LITLTIKVSHVEQLSRVPDRIGCLPNVREVRRQKG
jgi:(p)ppGpp synthase/HD superfamily hydrolase